MGKEQAKSVLCWKSEEITENTGLQVLSLHLRVIWVIFSEYSLVNKLVYNFFSKERHSHASFGWLYIVDVVVLATNTCWLYFFPSFPSLSYFIAFKSSCLNDRTTMTPLFPTMHVCSWVSVFPLPRPPSDKKFFSLPYETETCSRHSSGLVWSHFEFTDLTTKTSNE